MRAPRHSRGTMCPSFAFQCPCRSSSPGLTGRSSIPETAMLEPRSRGVLDASHSQAMTQRTVARSFRVIASHPVGAKRRRMTDGSDEAIHRAAQREEWIASSARAPRNDVERDAVSHSRGMIYPRVSFRRPSKEEGAGNAGCALHPRSRVQDAQRKRTRAYRFSGGSPAFPAQWFYGLCRALLGDEFVLSPSLAD